MSEHLVDCPRCGGKGYTEHTDGLEDRVSECRLCGGAGGVSSQVRAAYLEAPPSSELEAVQDDS